MRKCTRTHLRRQFAASIKPSFAVFGVKYQNIHMLSCDELVQMLREQTSSSGSVLCFIYVHILNTCQQEFEAAGCKEIILENQKRRRRWREGAALSR